MSKTGVLIIVLAMTGIIYLQQEIINRYSDLVTTLDYVIAYMLKWG